jgi:hypothetical protein
VLDALIALSEDKVRKFGAFSVGAEIAAPMTAYIAMVSSMELLPELHQVRACDAGHGSHRWGFVAS